MAAVTRVLEEVGAIEVPRVEVYNKVDLLSADERRRVQEADPSAMLISADTGDGCDELLDSVASKLALDQERVTIELDLADPVHADRLAWLYRHATVHSHATMGDRATLEADVPRRLLPMVGLATPVGDPGRRPAAWVGVVGGGVVALVVVAACAPKAPPAVVGAPKHPDFMFPVVPPEAAPAQAARIDRGWTYLQLDDYRNAEREFAAALKQQPSFHPAETAMAYVSLARGNEKDAATRFERALQAEPAYVPALIGRGQALLELDRDGDALASFEAALAKDPSLTDLRSRVDVLRFRAMQDMLARAKAAADARRWDEATAIYQQAIAASPDSAFLYRDLATVEQQAGQTADALEHYRKAVELDATDARSLAAIGAILEEQGDALGALAAYERARGDRPRRSAGRRDRATARRAPRSRSCPRSIARFPANRR